MKGSGPSGAILVSGLYELTSDTDSPPQRAYFGEDLSKWSERSMPTGLVTTRLPMLVTRAQIDPPAFAIQGEC